MASSTAWRTRAERPPARRRISVSFTGVVVPHAYAIAFLACARAGLVHLPVNALTGEELVYLLDQSGSQVVLTDPALAAEVEKVRDRVQVEHVVGLRPESAGGGGNVPLSGMTGRSCVADTANTWAKGGFRGGAEKDSDGIPESPDRS